MKLDVTPKLLIRNPQDLPDFSAMTPEQEALFWETHDLAPELFEAGPQVGAELDALLGLTDADKHSKLQAKGNSQTSK
ncbi:MAG: hypothetical protein AAF708_07305 [Deinococcota bacterium]